MGEVVDLASWEVQKDGVVGNSVDCSQEKGEIKRHCCWGAADKRIVNVRTVGGGRKRSGECGV